MKLYPTSPQNHLTNSKVSVFTVALQLPVNFLSVSSFFPTFLLYSAFLPSSPLLTQPYSSTSHVSFPLLHFSSCLGAPPHKLQAHSCLRAFAHVPFFPRHPYSSYLSFLQLSLQMSPNQRDLTPSTFYYQNNDNKTELWIFLALFCISSEHLSPQTYLFVVFCLSLPLYLHHGILWGRLYSISRAQHTWLPVSICQIDWMYAGFIIFLLEN